jgi:two-component system nitrogen regulation response regulator GlnG
LRERGDDLPLLVRHYLRRFSRELGREVGDLAPEALERLRSYSWPGNVRELQSVLKQALLQARGTTLLPTFLPALPGEASGPVTASPVAAPDPNLEAFVRLCLASGESDLYAETHRQVDQLLLTRVLEDTCGNQLQAARRLGISRDTLRRRLIELGLHLTRRLEAGEDEAG